ncbi:MAG: HAD-superfamily hydrolase, subfamily [Frankiales bacterium]|nr:HAD-superfamily hydrolase, subfamily [Frankiales bacterium]
MLDPVTPAGRLGLAALRRDPRHAVVALDYDGTLAPIVSRPEEAVPQVGTVEVLTALAGRVGRIALVTGRPADVVVALAGLAPVPGLVVLGQYGVQRWQAGSLAEQPPAPGLAEARRALPSLLDEPGVQVEDKGLSLVVHTRQADDPVGALARLHPVLSALAARTGLQLTPGRLVLELRPRGYDKGRALRTLVDGSSAVLFAGDDLGDLAAFDTVDALREEGTEGLLVCSDSEEAPEALRSRADLVVPGPPGVVQLLNDLAGEL